MNIAITITAHHAPSRSTTLDHATPCSSSLTQVMNIAITIIITVTITITTTTTTTTTTIITTITIIIIIINIFIINITSPASSS
jgi:hypothetical protein